VSRKRRTSAPASAVIDACCLIDLLASGRMEAILGASGHVWHLPDSVIAEVRFVRQHNPTLPGSFLAVPVDLSRHVKSGLLTACRPVDLQEQSLFVQYATRFRSDGEAMCLAIAQARGWVVATDDRKALRIARAAGISAISCPELVKTWANATKPDRADLIQVLAEIQTLARFLPGPTMPESSWWVNQLGR
jgi:hypothetical protein